MATTDWVCKNEDCAASKLRYATISHTTLRGGSPSGRVYYLCTWCHEHWEHEGTPIEEAHRPVRTNPLTLFKDREEPMSTQDEKPKFEFNMRDFWMAPVDRVPEDEPEYIQNLNEWEERQAKDRSKPKLTKAMLQEMRDIAEQHQVPDAVTDMQAERFNDYNYEPHEIKTDWKTHFMTAKYVKARECPDHEVRLAYRENDDCVALCCPAAHCKHFYFVPYEPGGEPAMADMAELCTLADRGLSKGQQVPAQCPKCDVQLREHTHNAVAGGPTDLKWACPECSFSHTVLVFASASMADARKHLRQRIEADQKPKPTISDCPRCGRDVKEEIKQFDCNTKTAMSWECTTCDLRHATAVSISQAKITKQHLTGMRAKLHRWFRYEDTYKQRENVKDRGKLEQRVLGMGKEEADAAEQIKPIERVRNTLSATCMWCNSEDTYKQRENVNDVTWYCRACKKQTIKPVKTWQWA